MFSMCSELTPRARIPDTRIPQLMQPWLTGYACRLPMICGCQSNYFMWLMWLCGCCGWKSILLYVCLSPNFPLCIQVGEAWCTKSGKKTGSPPTSSAPYMTFCPCPAHIWPWVKSNLMFVIFSHYC